MVTETGNCVLIIDGQRFEGINLSIERDGRPQAFGFLSGRTEVLRMARTALQVHLELEDGTTLPLAMLQVSPAGTALVTIGPKLLGSRDEI